MSYFRKKSIWVYHFNSGGCNGCDIEFVDALTPKYDVERLGVQLVSSPRHADVLVVTGPITTMAARALRNIYEQMPEPKKVVALGTCACTGGIFAGGYNVIGGADKVVPVDVKIPGCPAHPGVFLKALASLAGVERDGG
ncbi:NADH-quinone oxidoreductase subunit B family protein [Thermogladius sp. KZ2Tp1]|uniref:NADH-quinone oxidoreductase subunit B family protein n=1 Tax=Thermogladius sp. KZ2Tp1 TaxID=3136289 RepID=UPI003DA9B434